MSASNPNNQPFDLESEIQSVAILRTLIFELKQGARSSATFERSIEACENLCKIAQAPNHYLGLELIKLLDAPQLVSNQDIANMVNAFMFNITSQIDYLRQSSANP